MSGALLGADSAPAEWLVAAEKVSSLLTNNAQKQIQGMPSASLLPCALCCQTVCTSGHRRNVPR